jgi:hypothetical protein
MLAPPQDVGGGAPCPTMGGGFSAGAVVFSALLCVIDSVTRAE